MRHNCHACGAAMIESTDVHRNDGVCWRYRDRNCRRDVSIRDGSFFGNGSKLELEKVMDLLYSYLYETASFKNLMQECRIASKVCINWRNFVQDIYGDIFIRHLLRMWSRPCS